jgi:uncharacterized coiled-coil DUF342 family protein
MKRSKKKSSRVYKKRNDGTSDFELGLALSDDYANSEALSRLTILEKEKKSLKEEIAKLKDCCDERDELRKQIEELTNELVKLNEQIKKLQEELDGKKKLIEELLKFKDCESAEINELRNAITRIIAEKDRIIAEKDRIIAEKDRIIAEKDRIIAEKDRKIREKDNEIIEIIHEKDRACDFLKEIYNKYNNREINLTEFLQYMKNFIQSYCNTTLPPARPPTRPPPPPPSARPHYEKSTLSSELGYDPAGGKKGRSSDGLKKNKSKKVLKHSPRRSRKLKRSSKKKRN